MDVLATGLDTSQPPLLSGPEPTGGSVRFRLPSCAAGRSLAQLWCHCALVTLYKASVPAVDGLAGQKFSSQIGSISELRGASQGDSFGIQCPASGSTCHGPVSSPAGRAGRARRWYLRRKGSPSPQPPCCSERSI